MFFRLPSPHESGDRLELTLEASEMNGLLARFVERADLRFFGSL